MRTTSLTTAGLLGLALLAPATWSTPAGAADTCRGETATIVGAPGTLTGTEGRDVIVTGAATRVLGLGGDDLICVVLSGPATSNVVDVDAGAGNDLVDTTGLRGGAYASATLGAGADRFVGGDRPDDVYAGEGAAEVPGLDTEVDTVETGGGGDSVWTGSPGAPNADVVRTGSGDDQLMVESPDVADGGVLDGGGGRYDLLSLSTQDGDVALDARAGSFTSAAGTGTYTGLEQISVVAGSGTISYAGYGADENLDVYPTDGVPLLDVTTRGGADVVTVEPATVATGSRIATGAGIDRLITASSTATLDLDIVAERLRIDDLVVPVTGVENAWLLAPTIRMVAGNGDNDLTWSGCNADLRGGPGDDSLAWRYDTAFETYEFNCAAGDRAVMAGGRGRDHLRGNSGDDVLDGGAGADTVLGRGGDDRIDGGPGDDTLDGGAARDRADGAQGRDRCRAERTLRCERR